MVFLKPFCFYLKAPDSSDVIFYGKEVKSMKRLIVELGLFSAGLFLFAGIASAQGMGGYGTILQVWV